MELIGRRFGKLTVVDRCMDTGGYKLVCKCDCGNYTNVFANNLYTGRTKSCGCTRGNKDSGCPLYGRYSTIKHKGCTFESFDDFRDWLTTQGVVGQKGYSVRRIDTTEPFSRENCYVKYYD